MRFRTQLWIALTLVGVVPAVVMGALSLAANRAELTRQVGRMQTRSAEALGQLAEQEVLHAAEDLKAAGEYLPFDALSAKELGEVLAIPYRQFPHFSVVALVDERGKALAPPVYTPFEEGGPPSPRALRPADVDAFAKALPLAAALRAGVAVSPPYRHAAEPAARVAIAVKVEGRVLAAELSLAALDARVKELAASGSLAILLDGQGRVISSGDPGPLTEEERALVAEGLAGGPRVRAVSRAGGGRALAAFVPMGTLGWAALIGEPESVAFAAAERVRRYSLFWAVAAAVAVAVLGVVLARGIARPVAALSDAAAQLRDGRYDRRVQVSGRNELGQFAEAFNHMAEEITRREAEIRRFNAELRQRVDERTAELKAAQDQIQRSRRLAALGSLGAGVAHELNNPMTAIMGLVSLVRSDLPKGSEQAESLTTVLEEARRITQIVGELRELTAQEREGGGCRFSLAGTVRTELSRHAEKLSQQNIALTAELTPDACDVQGDPEQIGRVVGHLVDNAIRAMPTGGALRVQVAPIEGDAVKLAIEDTGRGIPKPLQERIFDPFFTTKADPRQVGLGLSISHRIVERHHGRILVDSAEGRGSTFTVVLPRAAAAAHLF